MFMPQTIAEHCLKLKQHSALCAGHHETMDASLKTVVGRNVYALRTHRGWTQGELSRRAGGDPGQTSISATERGVYAATLDTIQSLAEAFGVEPWLLLVPGLDPGAIDAGRVDAILKAYLSLPDDARAQLDRVAEAESRYSNLRRT